MTANLYTSLIAIADPGIAGVYNSTYAQPADWFIESLTGGKSDSGIKVNSSTAMTYAPWFQGISIVSGDVARVSADVFERTATDDRIKHHDHPAYRLLNRQASRVMTGYTVRQLMQSHAMNWGNGYSEIVRDRFGEPAELIPLDPGRTYPVMVENELYYVTRDDTNGDDRVIVARDMLHIRGLGCDGLVGYSVYRLARESIGLGLASEKHGSRHMANGARPGVILEYPRKLSPEEAAELLDQWESRHGGSDNTSRPALAAGGLKITPLSMSNEDSQWIASRKFQRVDVASWLLLPPHKLGDDSRLSYNSVEAEERSYVSNTLARWFRAWESECNVKLLSASELNLGWYIEHNVGGLIQGDFTTQATVAVQLRQAKIITQNEARKKFNLNAVEGGDGFENPNTSVADGPAESMDPNDPTANAKVLIACQALVTDRIRHLASTESAAVARAASGKDPAAAIARFYDRFELKFATALDPCLAVLDSAGGDCEPAEVYAARYCEQSTDILNNLVSEIPKTNLQGAVKAELSSRLESRVEALAQLIFGATA